MNVSVKNTIFKELKRLSPEEFENLTFDIVVLAGLRNAQWLTPGADGGRDIKGEWITQDFSGMTRVERWHVECKHYSSSLDWPTVYKKISYADCNQADFLMIVTSSVLSPACKRELDTWEKNHRTPKIRYWDKTNIISKILIHPFLLDKYKLSSSIPLGDKFLSLINIMSRTIFAAYGRNVFSNEKNPELELAGCLQRLFEVKSRQNEFGAKKFSKALDAFEWCDFDNGITLDAFEADGLRVIFSAIRLVTKKERLKIIPQNSSTCTIPISIISKGGKLEAILNEVMALCDIEASINEDAIILKSRGI